MVNNKNTNERSVSEILSDLKTEIAQLLKEEVSLARVELTEKSRRIRRGVKSAAVGGVFALGGFLGRDLHLVHKPFVIPDGHRVA